MGLKLLLNIEINGLPQMHKEGVENIEYEDNIVSDDLAIFSPPINMSNQLHLGIMIFLLGCQNKITEKFFKVIFSLLIPNMIIRTLKLQDSYIHILFNVLVINISIYISTIKVKYYGEKFSV